jgi:RND family efflux transporter MFP subunit
MVVAEDRFDRQDRQKGQASARPRPKSRRWWIYGLAAAAILAAVIAGVLLFRPGKPAAAAAKPAPSLTVTVAMPHRVSWADQLETSGAIAPWQEASIGAQIGGYQLSDVRVNVGDQVKKGEILARFDQGLLRADEAQLAANYDQAAQNEKRALALQQSGAMAEQSVLAAVTASKTALAALEAKRLQLRYADVVAPDDGVISSRTATLGAVMPVGQELFRMIRQNRLEWRGELTAAQIVHIAAGQRIALTLPDGSAAVATVRQTAPALDSQSRLGTVYADIASGSHARAGMYANGRVALGESPALAVPAEAVVVRDGRNYVLKLADDSATPRVSRKEVVTGRRQGDDVEIVRGLGEKDRIVAEGAGFLGDNDVVRLAPNSANSAAR